MSRRSSLRRHGSARPEPERKTQAPLLQEACADRAEVLALSVSRFIAAGALTGDAACWDAAHDCAEALLGPVEGPHLVAAMAAVMRAIRAERLGEWRFMPATCCRLTPDEAALARAFGVARRGRPCAIAEAAQVLAGDREAPRLAACLEVAAAMLDGVELALGRSPDPGRPGLASMH